MKCVVRHLAVAADAAAELLVSRLRARSTVLRSPRPAVVVRASSQRVTDRP